MAKFLAKPVIAKNGGDEGGEILLEKADTNTTLSGTGVTIDVYQNKLRFFEQGGTARGAYIDLTAAGAGVATNLLSGGGGATTLDGLNDVVVPTPSSGQILSYDGTNWVNIDNYATATKNTVKNDSGASLGVGSVVYTSGANGTNILVKGAKADAESTSATVLGFLESALAINGIGFVVTHGLVAGLNTGSASAGDPVWLSTSTAGGFVTGLANKPSSPNHLVYLGTVTRAHATNGEIFVHILNGWELEELHNVTLTSPQSGDFLKYNGSVWVNDPIDLGTDTNGNYMSGVSAGTGISVTHTPAEGSTATIAVDTTYSGFAPVGAMLPWAGGSTTTATYTNSDVPSGWLLCDGQAVSRTTYSALFSVIDIRYGQGDGSTTFNLPNLMSQLPIGSKTANAKTNNVRVTSVSVSTANATVDHTHNMNASSITNVAATADHTHNMNASTVNVASGDGTHQHYTSGNITIAQHDHSYYKPNSGVNGYNTGLSSANYSTGWNSANAQGGNVVALSGISGHNHTATVSIGSPVATSGNTTSHTHVNTLSVGTPVATSGNTTLHQHTTTGQNVVWIIRY